MAHDIHWEPHGVYKKYLGHVTGEEFLQAVERVNAHPDFESFRYVINDFTGCESVDIKAALLDLCVAAALGAQLSNSRFAAAFVAADAAVLDSINAIADSARADSARADSARAEMTILVFQTLEEARHWADSL